MMHEHATGDRTWNPYPLRAAAHNLFEILKQCCLIEDHLTAPDRRCVECISKHGLKILAYAEEAQGLQGSSNQKETARMIARQLGIATHRFARNFDPWQTTHAQIRQLRKRLHHAYLRNEL
jgi:hypothetical protein